MIDDNDELEEYLKYKNKKVDFKFTYELSEEHF